MLSQPDINILSNGEECSEMAFMCPVQMEKPYLSLVNQLYQKERHKVPCNCLREDWMDFCEKCPHF